jgi:hypothetical protein
MLSIAVGALGLGIAAGAAWVGSRRNPVDPRGKPADPIEPVDPRRDWARAKARGPLPELVEASGSYLAYVDAFGSDEVLWSGVRRLADAALSGVGSAPETAALRTRMLERLRGAAVPLDIRQRLAEIEAKERAGK